MPRRLWWLPLWHGWYCLARSLGRRPRRLAASWWCLARSLWADGISTEERPHHHEAPNAPPIAKTLLGLLKHVPGVDEVVRAPVAPLAIFPPVYEGAHSRIATLARSQSRQEGQLRPPVFRHVGPHAVCGLVLPNELLLQRPRFDGLHNVRRQHDPLARSH